MRGWMEVQMDTWGELSVGELNSALLVYWIHISITAGASSARWGSD